ncbi:hypothetical protein [Pelagicoccus sp. SDUM812003]|uniref:hypothetical protein n=1 Tax=Pelagicoccus sp. SDUM812003 TaxID=3041267 RepID=UPI00280F0CD3|nr:hypothetical protein [Pelagicoccus sp. SDUM812003]MDQ8202400.1 hypothetical protein [Pelagicoccus sp. SDUM812003]
MDSLSPLQPIPSLPAPEPEMSWRSLNRFRQDQRREAFYLTCLRYGQHLWLQRLPARAILCLDRAWGAELQGHEAVLRKWPLPYLALLQLLKAAPADAFLGNPRVHFQHYADRLGAPRIEQRKWRSWACWALTRAALPDLPGDPKHQVEEPTLETIARMLDLHGHPGETQLWQSTLAQT